MEGWDDIGPYADWNIDEDYRRSVALDKSSMQINMNSSYLVYRDKERTYSGTIPDEYAKQIANRRVEILLKSMTTGRVEKFVLKDEYTEDRLCQRAYDPTNAKSEYDTYVKIERIRTLKFISTTLSVPVAIRLTMIVDDKI